MVETNKVECPNCFQTIVVDIDPTKDVNVITCPNCGGSAELE
jgi:transcription elongation factor Elf1